MKAYKIEILVLDFEDYGSEEYVIELEQNRHLNAKVLKRSSIDIGEWDDDHPLNQNSVEANKWLKDNEK